MAEENAILGDINFIPLETTETNENTTTTTIDTNEEQESMITETDTDTVNENFNLAQDFILDNLQAEEQQQQQKTVDTKEESESNLNNCTTPEEQHVESNESPSTVAVFTFKCAFCDHHLTPTDNPKLLQCLHNSCANCINGKLYENHDTSVDKIYIECPLCSLPSEADKIIENQFLMETHNEDSNNAKLAELKCSSCSDDAVATSWCLDCSEYICDNCVQAHQRLKITKDHTIKSKEYGLSENNSNSNGLPANLFCNIHPHEKLSLFCESCDKLTCRDCQLIEHREHRYKFTNEIATDTRKFISDMLKDVGYKRSLLTSAMKVIDDRQKLITEKKQALVNEITNLVVKLTNTINVRGKQLVSKLTEVCESKQKTLQEKKLALEQLSTMTDHCIEFTQHALDNGSDMALLFSKKQVTDHLLRIKCKRADIPNPEIPVRIHLALDKVPDLIKVMSTIGQIVVDGRIYPSQTMSPISSSGHLPPHGTPSPSLNRPPQEQSPLNPMQQQQQQQQQHQRQPSPSYPSPRGVPPGGPYGMNQNQQQYGGQQQQQQQQNQQYPQTLAQTLQQPIQQQQNMSHVGMQGQMQNNNMAQMNTQNALMQQHQQQAMQNVQQSLVQKMSHMRPPQMGQLPLTLTQQLNNIPNIRMQRPIVRQLLPRLPPNAMVGLNQQQQQVSSSTHPQGMQDRSNLRGLLQPNNPVYVQTGPGQYQAVQPHIAQEFQKRYPQQKVMAFPPQNNNNLKMLMPNQQAAVRMIGPQQAPQMQQQAQQQPLQQQQTNPQNQFAIPRGGANWHIPQQMNDHANQGSRNMTLPMVNDNFKITLKPQSNAAQNMPATVTSTIPKTPSPNHVQGRSDTERNLDKFCEDSVKDLMATIAKLDSNGVQVLAEGRQKGGSPHVDSSTDDSAPTTVKIKPDPSEMGKDDPNEDWCAVCMDGGELVCCDKCPKVFHLYCHIPNLSVEENDTWQCLLCMNFADLPSTYQGEKKEGELSIKERKTAERIVLELYCQYDPSLPFREIVEPEHVDYHAIIKNPIALDTIRQKLNWQSEDRYRHMEQLIRDVRLMFKNAYTYNVVDSQVYNDAKTLEKFFDEQLEKFLPEYAYENFDDDDSQPPNKRYRRIMQD